MGKPQEFFREGGLLQEMNAAFTDDARRRVGMSPGRLDGTEKRVLFEKDLLSEMSGRFDPWDQFKQEGSPGHERKKRILFPAGVSEGVEAVRQLQPETFGISGELSENRGLRAGFAAALLTVIDSETKIAPLIPGRVEKAPDSPEPFVQVPQGPAAEPGNRDGIQISLAHSEGVLSQFANEDVFVLDVLVAGRPDGRAAGKTGLVLVRGA